MTEQEGITVKKSENFSEWFRQVIEKAGIVDQRYPLQGFLAYPWYGYAIHENCMKILEEILTRTGHKKCYFPLLIPDKLLTLEENHIAGFKDEVFWVTHTGGTPMGEKAALRPTSETAMYYLLKLWIRSYKNLPLKIHQSTAVYRYETKQTRPLMRDREILWNEAHTAHATPEEARKQVEEGMKIYTELFERIAVPVIFFDVVAGVFAGAEQAIEPYAVFPSGRSLEMGSVNNLGQKFSKAFDIKFLDEKGGEKNVYQTCYGVSERLTAAVIALHGDDKGLVLPPSVAPIEVAIIPIYNEKTKKAVVQYCEKVKESLAEFRTEVDLREDYRPGWKYNYYEMLGIPVRIEVGPKEVKTKSVTIVRRDSGMKKMLKLNFCVKDMGRLLRDIQSYLYKEAEHNLFNSITKAKDIKELKRILEEKGGFVRIEWCGNKECVDYIKTETKGGDILGPMYKKQEVAKGNCIWCKKKAKNVVYVAKLY